MVCTPFEKNLQFWRQLWRTMERSHLVCQIVDARNPLLFRCQDIERYATEMNINKKSCLLYTSPSPRDQRGSRMPSSA